MVVTKSFIDPEVEELDVADRIEVHVDGNDYVLSLWSSNEATPGPLLILRLSLQEAIGVARWLPSPSLALPREVFQRWERGGLDAASEGE